MLLTTSCNIIYLFRIYLLHSACCWVRVSGEQICCAWTTWTNMHIHSCIYSSYRFIFFFFLKSLIFLPFFFFFFASSWWFFFHVFTLFFNILVCFDVWNYVIQGNKITQIGNIFSLRNKEESESMRCFNVIIIAMNIYRRVIYLEKKRRNDLLLFNCLLLYNKVRRVNASQELWYDGL